MSWKPSAQLSTLKERAAFLQAIRRFFAERDVIEVDTPLLCQSTVTDPHLHSFAISTDEGKQQDRYLQTSPEYSMKRLLAAGCGPIYYLGKAFRKAEVGKRHNPEFTMLEWYRPGWDHHQLIAEVDLLMQTLLGCLPAEITTYAALFEKYLGIHPYFASVEELKNVAIQHGWAENDLLSVNDRDGWLDLLITHGIEHHLGKTRPLVVLDYPASQASLAKTREIKSEGLPTYAVAERFEFYLQGIELANGYHELPCPKELQSRFEQDLQKRQEMGLCALPIDHYLLDALRFGFPACAGVAIGVDRLLMLKLKQRTIAEVIPFAWEHA